MSKQRICYKMSVIYYVVRRRVKWRYSGVQNRFPVLGFDLFLQHGPLVVGSLLRSLVLLYYNDILARAW